MKIFKSVYGFGLLFLLFVLFIPGCGEIDDGGGIPPAQTNDNPPAVSDYVLVEVQNVGSANYPDMQLGIDAEWTVITYFAGDNNLGYYYDTCDIPQIRSVCGGNRMCFISLLDKTGTHDRVEINYLGTNYILYLTNELVTSDPEDLIRFVDWAIGTSPDSRYMLVMANHGSGIWKSTLPENSTLDKGWCDDSDGGDTLNALELETSISNIVADTGITGFDMFGAFCCNCGTYEIAYAVSRYCRYFLAFESSTYVNAWKHKAAYGWFVTNDTATVLDLCELIADLSFDQVISNDTSNDPPMTTLEYTVSVCDMTNFAAFDTALNALGAAYQPTVDIAQIREMMDIRENLGNLEYCYQIDIFELMTNIANSSVLTQTVKDAASEAYDRARDLVVYSTGYGKFGSISLYYPVFSGQVGYDSSCPYADIGAAQGAWGQMIVDPPYAGDVYEDDDTIAQAKPHDLGVEYAHNLYEDEDWVAFEAVANRQYRIKVIYGILMDDMELYDPAGTLLQSYSTPAPPLWELSQIELEQTVTAATNGYYYLRIQGSSSSSIPYPKYSRYTVEVSEI